MPARQTVVQWVLSTEHVSFANKYALARLSYADSLFNEVIDIADDSSSDWIVRDGVRVYNSEAVNRSRVRIDARKWICGRINPRKYGDKLALEDATPLTDAPPDLMVMARKIALAFRLAAMKEIEHAE